MLKPAICYKEQLEDALKSYYYTEDMFYFNGCTDSSPLNIAENTDDGKYQFVVVDSNNKLIGYIGFYVDKYLSSARGFGVFSFDRGNPIMGLDTYKLIKKLIGKLHRVEFVAIEGNPAIRAYDKFLKKYQDIGRRIKLTDETRDIDGNYRDEYIYEFVNPHN